MPWTIEAKRLPIPDDIPVVEGVFGHLYIEVWNNKK